MDGELPRIRRLDEATVNRIAAGEVVQRPSAALKELLENAIDAGATAITVTAKAGGMKLLQIQDNGHGIKREDLDIVCERFTTSKLRKFEDLQQITTFGFRGEALASITHVAHVTIISKTSDQPCAYKAKYSDGKLVPLAPGEPAQPKPCAGTTGTTIIVEDMFYNMPTRKQAFKNQAEQYQKIIDVVARYAIHFGDHGVSITCKKHGQASADIHTPAQSSTLGNIRAIHGPAVARELLELKYETPPLMPDEEEDRLVVKMHGYLSNANYNSKRATFILFINHRLVECAPIKRLIESVYTDILPKHTHPYVYLSLEMPPQHLDVNVHPTKREVHFMFEDKLLEAVHAAVRQCLQGANQSRVFYTRSVVDGLPVGIDTFSGEADDDDDDNAAEIGAAEEADVAGEAETAAASSDELGGAEVAMSTEDREAALPPVVAAVDEKSDSEDKEEGDKDKAPQRSSRIFAESSISVAKSASSSSSAKGAKRPREQMFPSATQSKAKPVYAHKLVRTDNKATTLDAFFSASQSSQVSKATATTSAAVSGGSASTSNSSSMPGKLVAETERGDDDFVEDGSVAAVECECPGEASENGEQQPLSATTASPSISSVPGSFAAMCDCCGKSRTQRRKRIRPVGDSSATIDTTATPPPAAPATATAAKVDIRVRLPPLAETTCEYDSIQSLLEDIRSRRHAGLESMLKQHTFVGIVDATFALVQFGTKLLMIDHAEFSKELFYQLVVRRFACMDRLQLSNPISVKEYVRAGLDAPEAQWTPEDGPKDELAESITNLLVEKGAMLSEYFAITIEEDGMLTTLPELVQGHRPLPELLPLFLIRLATETNWEEEKPCFESVATLLGWYYAQLPVEVEGSLTPAARAKRLLGERGSQVVQHQILPALKAYMIPPQEFSDDGSVIQVAALEQLYRVFERC